MKENESDWELDPEFEKEMHFEKREFRWRSQELTSC